MKNNRKISILIASIFLLSLLALPSYAFFDWGNKTIEEKTITIEKGESAKEIAFTLSKEKIISNPYLFIFYAILTGKNRHIQAGDYALSSQMGTMKILDIMVNGETAKEKITFIEGWDIEEIGAYLEGKNICTKEEFLTLSKDPQWQREFGFIESSNLEGYVFPDTYLIDKKATAGDIIRTTLKAFESNLTDEMIAEIKRQKKTLHDIIIMASMIEKEVRTEEDKKLVSGVLWNRLSIRMALQVDATVLYAMGIDKEKVYTKDTTINSPYNTYKYRGLPAGPISNPGLESIMAAIYPTKTNYFYYLSDSTGKTFFAKTLEEHNINKAKYLK